MAEESQRQADARRRQGCPPDLEQGDGATLPRMMPAMTPTAAIPSDRTGRILRRLPPPARLAPLRNGQRMRCLGHVPDIRALYGRCRVFLNPPRQGGGGGAAFALAEGLPVVTYGWGDGAVVSGPEFCVSGRDAFLERAVMLATDDTVHATAGAAAKARFIEIGDRNRCVERLIAYGEEARSLLRAERGGAN